MTVKKLIKELEKYDDEVVICMDENDVWDNILGVKKDGSSVVILFGGGSPFSSE